MAYTPVDIITIVPGSYTPGAESTLNAMADVINAAWNQANIKEDAFSTKMGEITEDWLGTAVAPHITSENAAVPSVTEPVVTIPASVEVGDVMALFDTKYLELVALLASKFTLFRSDYFPNEQATYSAAESWIAAAIANPEGGIPVAVANQLLSADKDRILLEAGRAQDAVFSTFAARRFPLPPGAAASAVTQIQQQALAEISESSRKLTTASIEQMRYAIDKALDLRSSAMQAAINYIQALASGPNVASSLVNTGYDAQSKLISAASQFYNARTDAAKLVASVNQFNASSDQSASEKNQMADIQLIEDRLKALLAETSALAQMATSLFNNVHASAGTSYGVNGT